MTEPTAPEMRPVSVASPGNDGFRYELEPAPERTPPDDTTEGEER